MLGIIYGLITYSLFAFHSVNMKKLSTYFSPRESASIHFYFIPLGIITFLISISINSSPISTDLSKFLGLSLLFGAIVSINILLGFYLYKTLNLSSKFKFTYGLTIILALITDFFFYSILPSMFSFIGALLFIISGLLLMKSDETTSSGNNKISLKHIGAIVLLTILMLGNRVILKELTLITTNDFAGIYLTQTIVQLCVFLCGWKYLKKVSSKKETQSNIIWYILIIYIAIIFEFYLHRFASLFVITITSNIKFFIFLLFDYKNKELQLKIKQIVGVLLGLLGIGMMIFFEWKNL